MIKKTLISFIAGFFIFFTMQIVFADNTPDNTTNISTVIQKLTTKGYNNIREVEFDHGVYKAETINTEGKEVKLHIDPQTYDITTTKIERKIKSKTNSAKLSMLDVIKKVEEAGYHSVYKIELKDNNKYELKALDKNGKKAELRVNANTGEINKEWF